MDTNVVLIAIIVLGLAYTLYRSSEERRDQIIFDLTERALAMFLNAEKDLKNAKGEEKFETVKEQFRETVDQAALDVVTEKAKISLDTWLQSVYNKAKAKAKKG